MECPIKYSYTIQAGDTLWKIARFFKTSVNLIMKLNPGIVPTQLWIGSQIIICPGSNYFNPGTVFPPVTPVPPIGTIPPVTPVPPIGTNPPVTPMPFEGTIN